MLMSENESAQLAGFYAERIQQLDAEWQEICAGQRAEIQRLHSRCNDLQLQNALERARVADAISQYCIRYATASASSLLALSSRPGAQHAGSDGTDNHARITEIPSTARPIPLRAMLRFLNELTDGMVGDVTFLSEKRPRGGRLDTTIGGDAASTTNPQTQMQQRRRVVGVASRFSHLATTEAARIARMLPYEDDSTVVADGTWELKRHMPEKGEDDDDNNDNDEHGGNNNGEDDDPGVWFADPGGDEQHGGGGDSHGDNLQQPSFPSASSAQHLQQQQGNSSNCYQSAYGGANDDDLDFGDDGGVNETTGCGYGQHHQHHQHNQFGAAAAAAQSSSYQYNGPQNDGGGGPSCSDGGQRGFFGGGGGKYPLHAQQQQQQQQHQGSGGRPLNVRPSNSQQQQQQVRGAFIGNHQQQHSGFAPGAQHNNNGGNGGPGPGFRQNQQQQMQAFGNGGGSAPPATAFSGQQQQHPDLAPASRFL